MAVYDFDLFCLGAGSGGVRITRRAGAAGKRVAVAEESRIGGTCVNRGCIPKKFYVFASHFAEDFEDAAGYGWQVGDASFDWPSLVAAKEKELARLGGIYDRMLADAGVSYVEGRGTLIDAHTVEVAGKRMSAEVIVINTGARPQFPDIPGIEHAISSDEVFDLDDFPNRLAIIGGGYIAVEFAGIFNGLGADVSLFYRRDKILRGFDEDVRTTLQEEMIKKAVDVVLETTFEAIEKTAGGLRVTTSAGEVRDFDQVLMATGRNPNTQGIGLEAAGVTLDGNGAIVVDEFSQTTADNIYAIGDVTDRLALTPIAIHEAQCLFETLYRGKPTKPNHHDVASAVFSQPTVSCVGYTEADARDEFGAVDIYRSGFKPLKHTVSGRDERAMMKLVVDGASNRVVGAHMVGPEAGEIIQGIAIAVKAGLTKEAFDATIGIHPTTAEEFVLMREKS